jgi:hypothetical protein
MLKSVIALYYRVPTALAAIKLRFATHITPRRDYSLGGEPKPNYHYANGRHCSRPFEPYFISFN